MHHNTVTILSRIRVRGHFVMPNTRHHELHYVTVLDNPLKPPFSIWPAVHFKYYLHQIDHLQVQWPAGSSFKSPENFSGLREGILREKGIVALEIGPEKFWGFPETDTKHSRKCQVFSVQNLDEHFLFNLHWNFLQSLPSTSILHRWSPLHLLHFLLSPDDQ